MTELKPCPFCGGEAEIRQRKVHHKNWFGKDYRIMYRVRCKKCGASVGCISACEFHRDERTGKEWGAIIEWNTRAVETCQNVDDHKTVWFICSVCGYPQYLSRTRSYCPSCGAKVVGE